MVNELFSRYFKDFGNDLAMRQFACYKQDQELIEGQVSIMTLQTGRPWQTVQTKIRSKAI